jgi:hypothetical protein
VVVGLLFWEPLGAERSRFRHGGESNSARMHPRPEQVRGSGSAVGVSALHAKNGTSSRPITTSEPVTSIRLGGRGSEVETGDLWPENA